MIDLSAEWVAVISLCVTTVGGAVAYVWTSRETLFKVHIAKCEAEIASSRLKIDVLQDKLLQAAHVSAEAARVQADTYQRLARSLEEQNAALKSVAVVVKAGSS